MKANEHITDIDLKIEGLLKQRNTFISYKKEQILLDAPKPSIGSSLYDIIDEYNSQSEPTGFAPNLQDGLFTELGKNEKIVNVKKLDFIKDNKKHVPNSPPEPLATHFEESELSN